MFRQVIESFMMAPGGARAARSALAAALFFACAFGIVVDPITFGLGRRRRLNRRVGDAPGGMGELERWMEA